MISEGARYTRNKPRYFLTVFSVGALCQVAFYIAYRSLAMCILITFSASILLIYSMQFFKRCLFDEACPKRKTVGALTVFVLGVAIMSALNYLPFFSSKLGLCFDAGFSGCLAPVFASLFDFRDINAPESLKIADNIPMRVACLSLALFSLIPDNPIQWFSLLALIPLIMYSEKRGRFSLKYFFYIFYPLHLFVLWVIYIVIH